VSGSTRALRAAARGVPIILGSVNTHPSGLSTRRRIAPALALFFLSPVCAEYLYGYDTSTGHLGELLAGLLILAPLYGGAAVLIRETARRAGRGWPSMFLLAFGFAVAEAGLVDQALFNDSYRDIATWDKDLKPTYIPALGIGAYNAVTFLVGHVISSIGAPIALVETFVPERRTAPWLGQWGLAVTAFLYLASSALIFFDHVETEQFLASPGQLIGASAVMIAAFAAAFAIGRPAHAPETPAAPCPWIVGAVAFGALSLPTLLEAAFEVMGLRTTFIVDWRGVALILTLVTAVARLVRRWSRREGWGALHRLALAGGVLLTNVWIAFLATPLGQVTLYAKLAHNGTLALGVLLLLVLAARAARRNEATPA